MCAISGVIGCALDEAVIMYMLHTMRRRGPDGSGTYKKDLCTLLHSRLAVVDLSGGSQPMHMHEGDDHYIITYNGELYNTEDIRKELLRLGHSFVSHSDTEVLLHAYVEWKENALQKLNGIFAFAIWDERAKKLFFARDRMGVKPLFYTQANGCFAFASEIKTLFASGLVRPRLDKNGIMQLIMLGPGREQGNGVFRDVFELKPGYYGEYADGRLVIHNYWRLRDRAHTEFFEETAAYTRWLVKDAISRQMVSDVPIGTFLSGGLDSSLITAICSDNCDGSLPTFSVDYENNDCYFLPGKFLPESDNAYIDIMHRTFQTDHSYTVLTTDQLLDALQQATIARDLPGMADVDFSLLLLSKAIRERVKVALSGECADEIFGGYPWYRDPEVRGVNGFPWAQNTALRASLLQYDQKECLDYVSQCYIDTINQCDILPENDQEDRRIKEMVNLNLNWFMQTLLDRKDRMSMYHGLEVRVPFCDHRIAEYLYGVPWRYKDHNNREKGLLRYAMKSILPDRVLFRKKSPYPKTFDPRYEILVEKRLKDVIKDKSGALAGILRMDAVEQLVQYNPRWPWYGQLMRKPQTMAYLLQVDFWLKEYHVEIV